MPDEMSAFLQEAKEKGAITNDDKFSVPSFFYIAKNLFHYSESEFWSSTPNRIVTLIKHYNEQNKRGGK